MYREHAGDSVGHKKIETKSKILRSKMAILRAPNTPPAGGHITNDMPEPRWPLAGASKMCQHVRSNPKKNFIRTGIGKPGGGPTQSRGDQRSSGGGSRKASAAARKERKKKERGHRASLIGRQKNFIRTGTHYSFIKGIKGREDGMEGVGRREEGRRSTVPVVWFWKIWE
jgi:hypothetical protein